MSLTLSAFADRVSLAKNLSSPKINRMTTIQFHQFEYRTEQRNFITVHIKVSVHIFG